MRVRTAAYLSIADADCDRYPCILKEWSGLDDRKLAKAAMRFSWLQSAVRGSVCTGSRRRNVPYYVPLVPNDLPLQLFLDVMRTLHTRGVT
jgi:hypothetical protein